LIFRALCKAPRRPSNLPPPRAGHRRWPVRELEFLPSWYPQARRRWRLFRMQTCSALLLCTGLALWMVLATRNVNGAQMALAAVDAQLAQSRLELDQLHVQLRLQNQLEVQRQIVSRLGLPVEMSRLISTLGQLMPKEMSIVELSIDTEESLSSPGVTPSKVAKGSDQRQLERRLRIKLLAVAPSDVDLANFLAGLTSTPFFQDVAPTFGRDKSEGGHMMREFEVTFSMSLNSPTSG
jgi:hypothetical protein